MNDSCVGCILSMEVTIVDGNEVIVSCALAGKLFVDATDSPSSIEYNDLSTDVAVLMSSLEFLWSETIFFFERCFELLDMGKT